jgi:hypothetical protein
MEDDMTLANTIRTTVAALLAVGTLAPAALSAGEPKNEWPFTRPVAQRATAQQRPSATIDRSGYGEPKNELPFTRPVAAAPVVIRSSGGFDWGDAGIGAGATIGIAVAALGVVALRTSRSPHTRGA